MLVLTRRPHDTIVSLAFPTPAQPAVGLSPAAPPDGEPPARFRQLVQKRLDIARLGLTELRRRLQAGQEDDAEIILKKIDEDLHMLQRRIRAPR